VAYQLIQADARRIPIADGSVHCCVTSPPYWSLRDYGTARWEGGDPACDHKMGRNTSATTSVTGGVPHIGSEGIQRDICGKCGARRIDDQLGLESTPEEYIAAMVRAFREVRRVLRVDSTLWLNLGDTMGPGKQLLGMPWRVALALQADGWVLRSEIIWSKANAMPESVEDRPTKSHEQLFLLAKRDRYFYDAAAVREGNAESSIRRRGLTKQANAYSVALRDQGGNGQNPKNPQPYGEGGRNLRSVWNIPTHAYPGSHFATMPPALVRPCIRAGTSERGVCPDCGAPWERVNERERGSVGILSPKDAGAFADGVYHEGAASSGLHGPGWRDRPLPSSTTTGWRPTCDCYGVVPLPAYPRPDDDDNDPDPAEVARIAEIRRRLLESYRPLPTIPPVVFDPFVGSGTTLEVAGSLGRRSIGLDLSGDYLKLARRRLDRPHARPVRPVRKESHPLFDHLEGENPNGHGSGD
jgi:DNA modification methylase